MPTPLEMYDALREATKGLPSGETFNLDFFDGLKLGKLTVDDFISRGLDEEVAERIIRDFRQRGSLEELGKALKIRLEIGRAPSLISNGSPQAETHWEDDQTLEEVFEELDRIRHPERYPV
jgi:hypothetical protein